MNSGRKQKRTSLTHTFAYPYGIASVNDDPYGDHAPSAIPCPRHSLVPVSHSSTFDHRRRPKAFGTEMANAFFRPTSPTEGSGSTTNASG